jgi:hypothetical protein
MTQLEENPAIAARTNEKSPIPKRAGLFHVTGTRLSCNIPTALVL